MANIGRQIIRSIGNDIFYFPKKVSCDILMVDNTELKITYPIKNKIDIVSLSDIEHCTTFLQYEAKPINLSSKYNSVGCLLTQKNDTNYNKVIKYTYQKDKYLSQNIIKIIFGQFINQEIKSYYKTLYTIDNNKNVQLECDTEQLYLNNINHDFIKKYLTPSIFPNVKCIKSNLPISEVYLNRFIDLKPEFHIPNHSSIHSQNYPFKIYKYIDEKKVDFGEKTRISIHY